MLILPPPALLPASHDTLPPPDAEDLTDPDLASLERMLELRLQDNETEAP